MKCYGNEPFGAGKARYMATGKKIPEKVDENFIKADKIGHEMYLLFVDKRLTKEKSDFFNPLKRLILK